MSLVTTEDEVPLMVPEFEDDDGWNSAYAPCPGKKGTNNMIEYAK